MNLGDFIQKYLTVLIIVIGFGVTFVRDKTESVYDIVSIELVGLKDKVKEIENNQRNFSAITIENSQDIAVHGEILREADRDIGTLYDELSDAKVGVSSLRSEVKTFNTLLHDMTTKEETDSLTDRVETIERFIRDK